MAIRTFAWLFDVAGGSARFDKMQLVLPTPEFFPIASDDERLAEDMLARVKALWPTCATGRCNF